MKISLDKIIHERARLNILTHLANEGEKAIPFSELQKKLKFSAGNLSIQLKKLKLANYIEINKAFEDNKPLTTNSLTP